MTTSLELEIHNRSKRFKESIARKAEELRRSKLAPTMIEATPQPEVQAPAEPQPDPIEQWVLRQLNTSPPIPFPTKSEFHRTIAALCKYFGVRKSDLLSKRRTARLAYARQLGMYIVRTKWKRSFPEIGFRFGGRDHTTTISGIAKIERLIKAGDEAVIADIAAVEAML